MNQRIEKIAALLAALVASLTLLACGGNGEGASTDATATAKRDGGAETAPAKPASTPKILVEGGEPVGGVEELEYSAGEEIAFEVESDLSDEVHVHGYDLMQDVEAGGSVEFSFPAEIEGIFEVELEGRGEQIAEIRVNP